MNYKSPKRICAEYPIAMTSLFKLLAEGKLTRIRVKGLRRTFIDPEEVRALFEREEQPTGQQ